MAKKSAESIGGQYSLCRQALSPSATTRVLEGTIYFHLQKFDFIVIHVHYPTNSILYKLQIAYWSRQRQILKSISRKSINRIRQHLDARLVMIQDENYNTCNITLPSSILQSTGGRVAKVPRAHSRSNDKNCLCFGMTLSRVTNYLVWVWGLYSTISFDHGRWSLHGYDTLILDYCLTCFLMLEPNNSAQLIVWAYKVSSVH